GSTPGSPPPDAIVEHMTGGALHGPSPLTSTVEFRLREWFPRVDHLTPPSWNRYASVPSGIRGSSAEYLRNSGFTNGSRPGGPLPRGFPEVHPCLVSLIVPLGVLSEAHDD